MTLTNKRQTIAEVALDFPSVSANSSAILTTTVKGAIVDLPVLVAPPAALDVAAIAAQGTLTMDTQPSDTDTTTIGSVEYTWLDSFVDADDNIFTGADVAAAKVNLVAAVMATGGTPGTTHSTTQVANADVSIAAFVSDDAVLTALVGGVAGNSLATTETFTAGTNVFDDTTLGTTTAGVDQTLSGLIADGWVSAKDEVSVRVTNVTGSAIDALSATFKLVVWT